MCVYFIEEEGTNRVKIGYSSDPGRRLRTMQTGNSRRLNLLFTIPGDAGVEKRFHDRYKHAQVRHSSEWFYFDSQIKELFEAAVMHNVRCPERHNGLPVLRGILTALTETWYEDPDEGTEHKGAHLQVYCPECQCAHHHGWSLANDFKTLSFRIAHCGRDSAFTNGYYVSVVRQLGVHCHPPDKPIVRPSRRRRLLKDS